MKAYIIIVLSLFLLGQFVNFVQNCYEGDGDDAIFNLVRLIITTLALIFTCVSKFH
jgi:hypothetical protein